MSVRCASCSRPSRILPWLSGVTISVDALARGLGARGSQRPRRRAPAGRGTRRSRRSARPAPLRATPGWTRTSCHGLPRPATGWPGPTRSTGHGMTARAFAPDVVHAHSPFVTGVLARRLARRAPRAARLHAPHPVRRLRPLPRPAGATRALADRCLPAPILGRLRRDHRPVRRPRRRDRRSAAARAARPRARHPDRHRRRRHPCPGADRAAGGARLAGRCGRDRHARAPGAGEESGGHPRGDARVAQRPRRARGSSSSAEGRARKALRRRAAAPDLAGRVAFTGPAASRGGAVPAGWGRPVRLRLADRDPGPRPGRGARRRAAGRRASRARGSRTPSATGSTG